MPKPGVFASFEGISGVGKSFFCEQLQTISQDLPIKFVSEIIDRHGDSMDSRIITLLRESGDRFFQNPYPLTTTFLLFAHTMYDAEAKIRPALTDGHILIKDRYIDSVAVYQALLLCPHSFEQQIALANELYQIGTRWYPAPDVTFLIEDKFDTAIHRAQERNGDCYRADELAILSGAAQLYDIYAQQHPSRIVRLNRQHMTNHTIVQCLRSHLIRCVERKAP
jgi:dTMP kinase